MVAILIIILAIIIGVSLLSQEVKKREVLKRCNISLVEIDAKNIGPTSITLDIKLRIYNPNTTTTTLDRVDSSLYGNYLGNGTIKKRVGIPPGDITMATIPFELSYIRAVKTIGVH